MPKHRRAEAKRAHTTPYATAPPLESKILSQCIDAKLASMESQGYILEPYGFVSKKSQTDMIQWDEAKIERIMRTLARLRRVAKVNTKAGSAYVLKHHLSRYWDRTEPSGNNDVKSGEYILSMALLGFQCRPTGSSAWFNVSRKSLEEMCPL